jgi:hypothetical protein
MPENRLFPASKIEFLTAFFSLRSPPLALFDVLRVFLRIRQYFELGIAKFIRIDYLSSHGAEPERLNILGKRIYSKLLNHNLKE